MPSIVHESVVNAPRERVFQAMVTPEGFCWAIYLRIMRRHLEHGDIVPYENRRDV
jgi:hypothetical protein